jgi:hypothetical protein
VIWMLSIAVALTKVRKIVQPVYTGDSVAGA